MKLVKLGTRTHGAFKSNQKHVLAHARRCQLLADPLHEARVHVRQRNVPVHRGSHGGGTRRASRKCALAQASRHARERLRAPRGRTRTCAHGDMHMATRGPYGICTSVSHPSARAVMTSAAEAPHSPSSPQPLDCPPPPASCSHCRLAAPRAESAGRPLTPSTTKADAGAAANASPCRARCAQRDLRTAT